MITARAVKVLICTSLDDWLAVADSPCLWDYQYTHWGNDGWTNNLYTGYKPRAFLIMLTINSWSTEWTDYYLEVRWALIIIWLRWAGTASALRLVWCRSYDENAKKKRFACHWLFSHLVSSKSRKYVVIQRGICSNLGIIRCWIWYVTHFQAENWFTWMLFPRIMQKRILARFRPMATVETFVQLLTFHAKHEAWR